MGCRIFLDQSMNALGRKSRTQDQLIMIQPWLLVTAQLVGPVKRCGMNLFKGMDVIGPAYGRGRFKCPSGSIQYSAGCAKEAGGRTGGWRRGPV